MASDRDASLGPQGGVRVNERVLRGWRWIARDPLVSQPVRCRQDDTYLVRARLNGSAALAGALIELRFSNDDQPLGQRCVRLLPLSMNGAAHATELVGWVQTPPKTTHLQVHLPDAAVAGHVDRLTLHDVAAQDAKCHPWANVPRWDTYRPPFALETVYLPRSLAALEPVLGPGRVKVLDDPPTAAAWGRTIQRSAAVLDPAWAWTWKLTWRELRRLAADAWVLVDLDTLARLLRAGDVAPAELVTHESAHGMMAARCEYADVPTRGLALQDVVPYAVVDETGGFQLRGLRATRGWKRYADDVGFATLLSSETPWEDQGADVLSAVLAVERGEVLATDLPWLVGGRLGPLVAPRMAAHLLRMHLGGDCPDGVQYWTRWDSGDVVVRDISDLARRYPLLRPVRWASDRADIAHLGLALVPDDVPVARHLLLHTGRIDRLAAHDGLPPEPMMIYMKWLARELRAQTAWARQTLAGLAITWQFDSCDGLRYAANYESAAKLPGGTPRVVDVRMPAGGAAPRPAVPGAVQRVELPRDEGLHGDGSLEFQADLQARLAAALKACGVVSRP